MRRTPLHNAAPKHIALGVQHGVVEALDTVDAGGDRARAAALEYRRAEGAAAATTHVFASQRDGQAHARCIPGIRGMRLDHVLQPRRCSKRESSGVGRWLLLHQSIVAQRGSCVMTRIKTRRRCVSANSH